MRCSRFVVVAVLAGSLMWLPSVAMADVVVYGTAAPLTGSRDADLGELTTNAVGWGEGVLMWDIVNNGNGTFKYTYTFSNFNSPGISHFTLDISDDALDGNEVLDTDVVTDATLDGGGVVLDFGDKDGITGAVKFDGGGLVYMFTSNRSPVYGDFYVKGGNLIPGGDPEQAFIQNVTFGSMQSHIPINYIARPNGVAIPEPSAFLFCGLAVCLAGARRVGRRFAK